MFIYSKKIIRFMAEIKAIVRDVLTSEIQLKVSGNRFYNKIQTISYPIRVVIYNNKTMWGYFDSHFYELGFHERLLHANRTLLTNVIRHELAHYMTFIHYGPHILPHGAEFKRFCLEMGWGEEVFRASCTEEVPISFSAAESSISRRIQKLMALGSSSSQHEAEQAMIKSQQLLLKHNIESHHLNEEDQELFCLKRILKDKKETSKMRSIARILETFFVSTVYHRAGEFTYLEILGTSVNVEIAEYVALFLEKELDLLWLYAQKSSKLKGMIAKNSFFLGVARGYCDKIDQLKKEYPEKQMEGLIVIEKKLIEAQEMAYERLSRRKSYARHCEQSSLLGEKMGRSIQINPALSKSSTPSGIGLIS
jgi:hypothetical protein